MSSRQLRKLQQRRGQEKTTETAGGDSEENEDVQEQDAPSKVRPNLFAALGGEEEDEGETDRQENESDSTNEPCSQDASRPSPSSNNQIKKKKQKKKKKNKSKAFDVGDVEQEDEIDRAMRELKVEKRIDGEGPASPANADLRSRMSELLCINLDNLRAVNEMRGLFGREIMDSTVAEEQQEGGRRRRGPVQRQVDLETFLREPSGAPKLPQVTLRRNVFVRGQDHWPRQSAGGLTMREMGEDADQGTTEYAYVHDKQYDSMQVLFFACVQMGDPMRMVHLLKQTPYHVSTLLQVSSVAKQDQNMALSAELCERALFTFGRVATSAFRRSLERGKARLDFRRPENRHFWLAGYHHIKSLIQKGTYRTALEWAKLLYSLDPTDPYAMRHFIHSLAIRAREGQWLIDFMDEIALYCNDRDLIYLRQSLILAKLQTSDADGARRDLALGMQRLPWLYSSLFQELNIDVPPCVWGIGLDSDTKSFWTKLYLNQAKELWDNALVTPVLQDVASSLERVDIATLPGDDVPADLGATRLAYLEGNTALLAVAPRALLESQPNFEFDPLPPPEEDNIFSSEGTSLPWSGGRNQSAQQSAELLARIQHLMEGPLGAMAPQPGAIFHDDDESDDDEAIRAVRQADDEELQRDLDAHSAHVGTPGVLVALMQALGIRRDETREHHGNSHHNGDDDEHDDNDESGDESGAEPMPGAWPA